MGRALRGKMAAAVAAGVVILGGVFVASAPAQASTQHGCGDGTACLYSGYDYGTDWAQNPRMLYFTYCIDNLPDYSYNDITSSVYNNGRTDNARFYDNSYQGGYYYTQVRWQGRANLNDVGWNDRFSSAYFDGALGSKGTSRCK